MLAQRKIGTLSVTLQEEQYLTEKRENGTAIVSYREEREGVCILVLVLLVRTPILHEGF